MSGLRVRVGETRVDVSFPLLAALTAGAFLDPGLTGAAACAVLVHEGAHLLLLRAYRQPVRAVDCRLSGIRIQSGGTRGGFWCALAGPLGNLLLGAALLRVWTLGAAVSLVLGAVHLLPLPGSDGEAFLCGLRPERRDRAAFWFCAALCLLTAGLCAAGLCHPLIPAALLVRLFRRE